MQGESKDTGAPKGESGDELQARLSELTKPDPVDRSWRIGARLRNYFLTGLVVVGPITITILAVKWFIEYLDAWARPLLPLVPSYLRPETYLPFGIPGLGLVVAFLGITIIGWLAASFFGRAMLSWGDMLVGRMPVVRNVYRAMKQIFESAIAAHGHESTLQRVGLMEFPSKGIWSIVYITGPTTGEIAANVGGGQELLSVFMPTGVVPPSGFVCFVPRTDIRFLTMGVEDAAKIIVSAGMVMPGDGSRRPDPSQVVRGFERAARRQISTPAAGPPKR